MTIKQVQQFELRALLLSNSDLVEPQKSLRHDNRTTLHMCVQNIKESGSVWHLM